MAEKFKIKKGDQVVVTTGREKGKKRRGAARRPPSAGRVLIVQGVNMVQASPRGLRPPATRAASSTRKRRCTCFQRRRSSIRSTSEPADARRLQVAGRRPQGSLRQSAPAK